MSPAETGGVLKVDKPEGPTSHDVVAGARRALDTRKIGHTGTLDPFASGLLLLCVGPATRLAEFLSGLDKSYLAKARLGVGTDSHDREGEVVAVREGWRELEAGRIAAELATFRGTSMQRPPVFSAKKVAGEAAHRRARRGEVVELDPVRVEILEAELIDWEPPDMTFRLRCSSGTYVRAVARDLGERLGTGAHLTELRRTAIGPFDLEGAVSGDRIPSEPPPEAWITPAGALAHLPAVEVDDGGTRLLANGRGIEAPEWLRGCDGPVAVVRKGVLVAVASSEGDTLRPRKVFVRP